MTTALSNPTMIQYVDKESGQLVTTTSSRQRKLLESQLNEAKTSLGAVTDSIAVLDVRILDAQIGNESAREVGPLKYMSTLTGQPMSKIVNWFMMLIIFVFDPLAIAMVVAANMAFAHVKGVARDPKDYEVYKKKEFTEEEKFEIEKRKYIEAEGDLSGPREYSQTKPEIIEKEVIKEVPVEVEKIVEKEVVKYEKHPALKSNIVQQAIKHAKRAGELK